MRRFLILAGIAAFCLSLGVSVNADAAGKKAKGEVVMKVGSKVHLFHGGSVEANKEISVGDVITAYRQTTRTGQMKEVGQLKVLNFIGDHYFEAEIVNGDVKVGDIAKGNAGAYLVQPAQE